MKRLLTLIPALLISISCFAQQGIHYKAVIKDGSGNLLVSQTINVRLTIQKSNGTGIYTEMHPVTTDINGIVMVNIGEGTVESGDFLSINWANDIYQLQTEIDLEQDDTYVTVGNPATFKTVPYALSSADNTWVKSGVNTYTNSEKAGINTTTPQETLDVNGRIKVGDVSPDSPNNEGTIRYNTTTKDFEGWTGSAWVSLTKSNNGWGDQSFFENNSVNGQNFAYHNGILAILGSPSVTIANYANGISSNSQTVYEDNDGPKFSDQIALHNNKLLVSAYTLTIGDPSSLRNYVYVFENQSGTWVKQAIISDPVDSSSTGFGFSLAIQDNLALISSLYYNSSAGRVYLYELSSGNWILSETFQGAAPAANFGFGQSISISGNNICIAEVGNDKVYLYEDSGLFGWVSAGTLTAPNAQISFGKSVDFDNDILAVTGNDNTSYIYEKTGSVWPATPSITIDQGGTKVMLKGNYILFMKTSKVHLYEFNNGIWGEIAQLSSMNGGTFQFYRNLELTDDNIVIVNVFGAPQGINFYDQN